MGAALSDCTGSICDNGDDDREALMAKLVEENVYFAPRLLEGASRRLRADREVVLAALALNGNALAHASAQFRDDPSILLEAMHAKEFPKSAMRFASERVRADREAMLKLLEVSGDTSLVLAMSAQLQKDPHFLEAVREICIKHYREDCKKAWLSPYALDIVAANGDVALLDGAWLCNFAQAKGAVLPRHQDLPREAFFKGPLAMPQVMVLALSYCWSSREHPDWNGRQLQDVVFVLQWLFKQAHIRWIAVFWDWASLPQHAVEYTHGEVTAVTTNKDSGIFEAASIKFAGTQQARRVDKWLIKEVVDSDGASIPKEGSLVSARIPRSEDEQAKFSAGLGSVNAWYASPTTFKLLLTELPEGSTKRAGYSESGWTTFEQIVSSLVTDFEGVFAFKEVKNADLTAAQGTRAASIGEVAADGLQSRRLPVSPEEFAKIIRGPPAKHFTSGADMDFVIKKYQKTFERIVPTATEVDFSNMPAVSSEEWAAFFDGAAKYFTNLKSLRLEFNEACTVPTAAFSVLPALELLHIEGTGVTGEILAFASCPNLKYVGATVMSRGLTNEGGGDEGPARLQSYLMFSQCISQEHLAMEKEVRQKLGLL